MAGYILATKPTIAIDFDGTMVTNAWPEVGEWQPGAVDALKAILKFANIVVHTCRIAPMEPDGYTPRPAYLVEAEKQKIREKLDAAGLRTIQIHDKPYKPSAAAYVDDKAVKYNGRKGAWGAMVMRLAAIASRPDCMMYPGYEESE